MNRVSIFVLLRPMVRPTIRRMQVREAKDFLVQETAKQASIEGVALSELEKRMMYFTESGYVPEDPVALNEEFEAQYDTDEYEAKIAKLLQHAYERAGKENDATLRQFDAAIRSLRRGDHYLLVMWDITSRASPAIFNRITRRSFRSNRFIRCVSVHAPHHASESADHSSCSCGPDSLLYSFPARIGKSGRLDSEECVRTLCKTERVRIRPVSLGELR